jgi:tRNA pseudouridine55 synthase
MSPGLRPPPGERSVEQLLGFGVLNLDKPPGPSAHQVSAWVRDLAGVERAAHSGTLDPKVTGCLPVLTGAATRAARAFDEARKGYVAVLELHGPAPAGLEATLAEFETELLQRPPRKSAVRRQLRTRTVHRLEALDRHDRQVLVHIDCDSGTYVRKLCHDLGLALGTGAHMGDLRRVRSGTFDDGDLVTMQTFVDALAYYREDGDEAPIREAIAPAERALEGLGRVTIARSAAEQVAEGAPVYAPGVLEVDPDVDPGADGEPTVACYTPDGSAVCLGPLVGDPDADSGTVVATDRVLV